MFIVQQFGSYFVDLCFVFKEMFGRLACKTIDFFLLKKSERFASWQKLARAKLVLFSLPGWMCALVFAVVLLCPYCLLTRRPDGNCCLSTSICRCFPNTMKKSNTCYLHIPIKWGKTKIRPISASIFIYPTESRLTTCPLWSFWVHRLHLWVKIQLSFWVHRIFFCGWKSSLANHYGALYAKYYAVTDVAKFSHPVFDMMIIIISIFLRAEEVETQMFELASTNTAIIYLEELGITLRSG